MPIIKRSSRPTADSKNRYPGKDEANWTVKGPTGIVKFPWLKKEPHQFESTVYNEVDAAARAYTKATGLFAQPVRA